MHLGWKGFGGTPPGHRAKGKEALRKGVEGQNFSRTALRKIGSRIVYLLHICYTLITLVIVISYQMVNPHVSKAHCGCTSFHEYVIIITVFDIGVIVYPLRTMTL